MNRSIDYHSTFSIDCVIFGFDEGDLKILLIQRAEEVHIGSLALPGNIARDDEDIDQGAARILNELTGLEEHHLEQLYTFGDVNRHPFGRVITVAYFALLKIRKNKLKPKSAFASNALWIAVNQIPKLPFDHNKIIIKAMERLKNKIRYQPIGFELLPEKFTLSQLQNLYESILQVPLDKRNFRKKILGFGLLVELSEKQKGVSHRAANLFKFDKKRYEHLCSLGFNFEL
ncbi:MAG: NUDIX hydrolase [Bacteroidetes bacterium]|nr:NUDIX hydrolase [Bacteroidota bacterium]